MRSIERRFANLQEKRPLLSSFMNFSGAIKGQGFSAGMIGRWFNKLVDKDDYDRRDKKALLNHLVFLNTPEEGIKQG